MKFLTLVLLTICLVSLSNAQVGVNTNTPSAALHIQTLPTNQPNLQLDPQTVPTGTATGQIAVIGDQLYMYDAVRNKWLSINATPLVFSRTGNVDDESLRAAGNVASANSGSLMPFDGTIVAITANSNTTSGVATNNLATPFNIRVRNGNTTIVGGDITITMASGVFTQTNTNVDFSAGNHFHVRSRNDGTGTDTISNPVVTIWVKWRQNNP